MDIGAENNALLADGRVGLLPHAFAIRPGRVGQGLLGGVPAKIRHVYVRRPGRLAVVRCSTADNLPASMAAQFATIDAMTALVKSPGEDWVCCTSVSCVSTTTTLPHMHVGLVAGEPEARLPGEEEHLHASIDGPAFLALASRSDRFYRPQPGLGFAQGTLSRGGMALMTDSALDGVGFDVPGGFMVYPDHPPAEGWHIPLIDHAADCCADVRDETLPFHRDDDVDVHRQFVDSDEEGDVADAVRQNFADPDAAPLGWRVGVAMVDPVDGFGEDGDVGVGAAGLAGLDAEPAIDVGLFHEVADRWRAVPGPRQPGHRVPGPDPPPPPQVIPVRIRPDHPEDLHVTCNQDALPGIMRALHGLEELRAEDLDSAGRVGAATAFPAELLRDAVGRTLNNIEEVRDVAANGRALHDQGEQLMQLRRAQLGRPLAGPGWDKLAHYADLDIFWCALATPAFAALLEEVEDGLARVADAEREAAAFNADPANAGTVAVPRVAIAFFDFLQERMEARRAEGDIGLAARGHPGLVPALWAGLPLGTKVATLIAVLIPALLRQLRELSGALALRANAGLIAGIGARGSAARVFARHFAVAPLDAMEDFHRAFGDRAANTAACLQGANITHVIFAHRRSLCFQFHREQDDGMQAYLTFMGAYGVLLRNHIPNLTFSFISVYDSVQMDTLSAANQVADKVTHMRLIRGVGRKLQELESVGTPRCRVAVFTACPTRIARQGGVLRRAVQHFDEVLGCALFVMFALGNYMPGLVRDGTVQVATGPDGPHRGALFDREAYGEAVCFQARFGLYPGGPVFAAGDLPLARGHVQNLNIPPGNVAVAAMQAQVGGLATRRMDFQFSEPSAEIADGRRARRSRYLSEATAVCPENMFHSREIGDAHRRGAAVALHRLGVMGGPAQGPRHPALAPLGMLSLAETFEASCAVFFRSDASGPRRVQGCGFLARLLRSLGRFEFAHPHDLPFPNAHFPPARELVGPDAVRTVLQLPRAGIQPGGGHGLDLLYVTDINPGPDGRWAGELYLRAGEVRLVDLSTGDSRLVMRVEDGPGGPDGPASGRMVRRHPLTGVAQLGEVIYPVRAVIRGVFARGGRDPFAAIELGAVRGNAFLGEAAGVHEEPQDFDWWAAGEGGEEGGDQGPEGEEGEEDFDFDDLRDL